jgi:uncharacterized protein (DUF1015 family)
MAVVRPFAGWRYSRARFANLADVVVPPYDVISEQQLAKLKKRNSHNFSNVILNEGEKKHEKAAELFSQWKQDGSLVHDTKPELYFYKQTFKLKPHELFCQNVPAGVRKGSSLNRTGILCRVGLEDYSAKVILPHEKTFSGPKADRYELMTAAQGNMEPVFLGYDSPRFSGEEFEKICLGKKPEYDFTDDGGVAHQLWLIDDLKVHDEVAKVLDGKKFYILDGHHRYETALQFYKDHQKTGARLDHRFVLANICSFKQPGTVILPTHRALRLENFNAPKWLAAQKNKCTVKEDLTLAQLEELMIASRSPAFGVRFNGSDRYAFLQINYAPHDKLDLEVLHQEILPELAPGKKSEDIAYIKDITEFEEKISSGELTLGFLVKPSTTAEVMTTAENGKVMPHKSTFFYPKIPSGLVINTFE